MSRIFHKSIDKYPQNGYDIQVCRIVRYKYAHLDITEASE